jgi:Na+/phosphate symporter
MIWILILGIVLIVTYEVWAIRRKAPGDTITEIFQKASKKPLLPFLAGMLAGHLVWYSTGACL